MADNGDNKTGPEGVSAAADSIKAAAKKPAAKKAPSKAKPAVKAKTASAKTAKAPTSKAGAPKTTTTKKTAAPKAATAKKATAPKATAAKNTAAPKAAASPKERVNDQKGAPPLINKDALKARNWPDFIARILFTAFFCILASFSLSASFILITVHFIIYALKGEAHPELQSFIRKLGHYLQQIFDYASLQTEERPFPLGKDFP